MTDASGVLAPPAGTGAAGGTASGTLAAHLAAHAGAFLRGLPTIDPGVLRRVAGALHTFDALLDPAWARELHDELTRLGALVGQEQAYTRRLARLGAALDSLACVDSEAAPGAPKARALLERQLTLARSRAHSLALQELGSARFHAVADRMTLLVSDLPLRGPAGSDPGSDPARALLPYAAAARRRLAEAVAALPLHRTARPYSGDALHDSGDDLPWRQVRLLTLRAHDAQEVCAPLTPLPDATGPAPAPTPTLTDLADLARLLGRHQDAADAAEAAALAGATPRITPATAYVLGVVHADQRLEVEATRHAFTLAWTALPHSAG